MPDTVGTIVTDAEVAAFVTTLDLAEGVSVSEDVATSLLIRSVEDTVLDEIGRVLVLTDYVDEEYDVPALVQWDGFSRNPVDEFQLNNYPVTQFTSLKTVTSRSPVTGSVLSSTAIGRDRYHVDLKGGFVKLLAGFGGTSSFPEGRGGILCSYSAGYAPVDMPPKLKVFVLEMVARLDRMRRDSYWPWVSARTDFGETELLRVPLSPEERQQLKSFKRPIFA